MPQADLLHHGTVMVRLCAHLLNSYPSFLQSSGIILMSKDSLPWLPLNRLLPLASGPLHPLPSSSGPLNLDPLLSSGPLHPHDSLPSLIIPLLLCSPSSPSLPSPDPLPSPPLSSPDPLPLSAGIQTTRRGLRSARSVRCCKQWKRPS